MAKGDIAPQRHRLKMPNIGGGLGHFKPALGQGVSKAGIFQASFKVMELGVDDRDLVIVVPEADSVGMESPLGNIGIALEEGMECRPWANQEIVEPSRQRLSGSVILDEGLCVNVGDEGSGGGPIIVGQHGNLSLSDLFDPLGRSKGTVGCWDDQGWVVPVILKIPLGGRIEHLFIVLHPVFQSKDATVETVFLELIFFLVLLHRGGQPFGNVSSEHIVGMLDEVEGCEGSVWGQGAWNLVRVMEHVRHGGRFGNRERLLGSHGRWRSGIWGRRFCWGSDDHCLGDVERHSE